MDTEELEVLCLGVRARTIVVDKDLVARIEADAEEYRRLRDELETPLPPDDVRARLWLFGWLIYETSWLLTNQVRPGFETLSEIDERARSMGAADLVSRLYQASVPLGWPELAPRALGAVRAAALVASKRDTARGYADAWQLHRESRIKYVLFEENLVAEDAAYLTALRETQLQLLLAETGTACRVAERLLTGWAEDVESGLRSPREETRWLQDIFRDLTTGAARGGEALDLVARIEAMGGLVESVGADRMALATAYRNPGIMTARALLLLLPVSFMLERQKRVPSGGHATWAEARNALFERFRASYRAVESDVRRGDGTTWELLPDHARSVVQLRLTAALLAPGSTLPSRLSFAQCLEIDHLGDEAVEALSSWLAEPGSDGRQRGDANVIGSATMPAYLREIGEMRRTFGVDGGYASWRRRWHMLDRSAADGGRRARVERALDAVDGL
ncbi:hypothetical protein GCM10023201_48280 [Actinomycetospora corticicola]